MQSTADAIMAPNEAARRAISEGATASQDGAIDTRGIRTFQLTLLVPSVATVLPCLTRTTNLHA